MKVVHWIPDALLGGCEIALLTLLNGSREHRHVILTDREGPACALWREAGAEVIEVGAWDHAPWVWARRFRKRLSDLAAAELLVWSPSRLPWLHAAASKAGVRRLVVHVGTNIPLSPRKAAAYAALHSFLRPKAALSLVCCSQGVADVVATGRYFGKFSKVVIHNGVRAAFFDVPELSGEAAAKPVIGNVARLDALKGQTMLIGAMPALIAVAPEAELRLIGEGPDRADLEALANRLGVARHVSFLGRRLDVPEQLAAMSVFVFPASPKEGMGIALAEAMAAGRPCVVSDTATMREVGGDAVSYADPSSQGFAGQVGLLLRNEPERRALSAAAKRRARELFSPEVFARRYLEILKG